MDAPTDKILTFPEFVISYVSLSVIAGLFTFRVINSLLDNIIFPIIELTILPDAHFVPLSVIYDTDKKEVNTSQDENNDYQVAIRFGLFLKEFIIWFLIMVLLFMLYKISLKF